MDIEKIQKKLAEMGFRPRRYKLEPFELLTEFGPAGAFDSVGCYELVDKEYHREFDVVSRDWRPVLVIGDEVLVGPSPEMLTRLLAAAGYFDRAEEFDEDLVFQLHGFSLDFYDDYEVREESLERGENEVTIRGSAFTGGGWEARSVPFVTRVVRGREAEFTVTDIFEEDLLPY